MNAADIINGISATVYTIVELIKAQRAIKVRVEDITTPQPFSYQDMTEMIHSNFALMQSFQGILLEQLTQHEELFDVLLQMSQISYIDQTCVYSLGQLCSDRLLIETDPQRVLQILHIVEGSFEVTGVVLQCLIKKFRSQGNVVFKCLQICSEYDYELDAGLVSQLIATGNLDYMKHCFYILCSMYKNKSNADTVIKSVERDVYIKSICLSLRDGDANLLYWTFAIINACVDCQVMCVEDVQQFPKFDSAVARYVKLQLNDDAGLYALYSFYGKFCTENALYYDFDYITLKYIEDLYTRSLQECIVNAGKTLLSILDHATKKNMFGMRVFEGRIFLQRFGVN